MPFRILIVDDHFETAVALQDMLSIDGYDVSITSTIDEAKRYILAQTVDVALLDVNLSEFSTGKNADFTKLVGDNLVGQEGFELAAWMHSQHPEVRIVFLTSRESIRDRIRGLDIGGDDYISKPFAPEELRSRIRSILRRYDKREERIEFFCGWKFNVTQGNLVHVTRLEMKPISLTNAESKILYELLDAKGLTVSRETLSKRVFGRPLAPQDRAVDTSISKLRSKMNDERGAVQSIIETMHGFGYRLIRR